MCAVVGRSALPLAGTKRPPPLPAGCKARGACFSLPREFDMSQPSPSKPGPAQPSTRERWWPEEAAPLPPCHGNSAEAGEAASHRNEAVEQLRLRVECLNVRLAAARTSLAAERPDLFDGIAAAFDGVKAALGSLRVAWEDDEVGLPPSQPAAAPSRHPPAHGPSGSAETDPWDAEMAEALTRVCEIAALEDHRRSARRPPRPPAPAAEPTTPSASALDARLAELAQRLQQALPRLDLAQWLGPIEARVRQLEREVATAQAQAGHRPDASGFEAVETRMTELAFLVERTSTELGRLDDMDAHLREVIAQLKKLSAATTAPRAASEPGQASAEPLEAMLKSSLTARRQDARTAVGVLKSIHHAVGEITERLDQWRSGERPAEAAGIGYQSDPDTDRDLLLKAYREGARALGETPPEAASDLAGLAPGPRRPARYDWSASTWHWHAED